MKFDFKKVLALGLAAGALAACSTVPAGHVGVKVYLLGSSKGVESEELGVGRYWIGINEELFLFPTYTQNYTWTKAPDETGTEDESISFQTIEGMSVNADVGITYRIDPAKVNNIFQKYRKGVTEITDIYLRNMVRDALVTEASSRSVEDVYGRGKAELMTAVEKRIKDQVEKDGIVIERIYWVGDIRLPDNVIASLNAKIQATQMAAQRQNEVAQSKAEAQKKVEEARGEAESILLKAKAQADANRELASSITPELVQYRALEKWDGVLPRMTGSNVVPFVNVDPTKGVP
jgi:regulator of protease activity HflC (stomatin/prohibitin superfamily)